MPVNDSFSTEFSLLQNCRRAKFLPYTKSNLLGPQFGAKSSILTRLPIPPYVSIEFAKKESEDIKT